MSNVVKFYPRGTPDKTLEACKGRFQDVLVIGYDEVGEIQAFSSAGVMTLPQANYLVDQFKHAMFTGYFETDDGDR